MEEYHYLLDLALILCWSFACGSYFRSGST